MKLFIVVYWDKTKGKRRVEENWSRGANWAKPLSKKGKEGIRLQWVCQEK